MRRENGFSPIILVILFAAAAVSFMFHLKLKNTADISEVTMPHLDGESVATPSSTTQTGRDYQEQPSPTAGPTATVTNTTAELAPTSTPPPPSPTPTPYEENDTDSGGGRNLPFVGG